jgi:3-methyl-2-oxobutanoate hydroxymethyltransferase
MGTRFTAASFAAMKEKSEPIALLTCYDYPTALRLDAAGVDVVFVGDSVGRNVLGYASEREVTMEDMLHHTRAVRRGVEGALLLVDMPFDSYSIPTLGVENALRLVAAGAEAVKLEGGVEATEAIRAIIAAGVTVLGHVGHMPQLSTDGRHVFGATAAEAVQVLQGARAVEAAGAVGIVLECVPGRVAEVVTQALRVPTIGIGAGRWCDGQVLVTTDVLGWYEYRLRFAKRYAEFGRLAQDACAAYVAEVKERRFPADEHRFRIKREELERFKEQIK